jgi:hemerythrin-like domain-containing protein
MGAIDEEAWDVYREIHKAARLVLCRAVMVAGAADATSDTEMTTVRRAIDEVSFVLRGHHGHERDFLDELVITHAPTLRHDVETAHVASDAALDAIEELADRVLMTPATDRNPVLHRLYLDLAAFTAIYLDHLDVEERRIMPALNEAMSREELIELTETLRGSIPPPEMCRFMQSMLPSMNLSERVDMLGGMSHAPPEIWQLFRDAAITALPPDEFDAVATRIAAE